MTINRITYLSDVMPHIHCYLSNSLSCYFYFNDYIEVKKFLDQLEKNQVYVITLDLASDLVGTYNSSFNHEQTLEEDNTPNISLSKPILVTSNSDPNLISNYILNRLKLASIIYNLEEDHDDKAGVTMRV